MYIPDKEKDGRKAALKKLVEMMGEETGKRLGGLKKPMMAEMSIEKMPMDEDEEMGMDEDHDEEMGEEPSEEEKMMISKLYHKYC